MRRPTWREDTAAFPARLSVSSALSFRWEAETKQIAPPELPAYGDLEYNEKVVFFATRHRVFCRDNWLSILNKVRGLSENWEQLLDIKLHFHRRTEKITQTVGIRGDYAKFSEAEEFTSLCESLGAFLCGGQWTSPLMSWSLLSPCSDCQGFGFLGADPNQAPCLTHGPDPEGLVSPLSSAPTLFSAGKH